jgi:hypothetical protein
MSPTRFLFRAPSLAALAAIATSAWTPAQIFTRAPASQFPQTGSATENVDFADVDLDGDWDAAVADGGDSSQDQNRLWLNAGPGAGLGSFVDVTATQMPILLDDSRDIEFVDFEHDGDFDLYTSNTAQLLNQGNHWLTNLGGAQSGAIGFYRLEDNRWVGVGQPGSSVPVAAVLAGGTFVDWSCDCDFADLDNDGDSDLFHSTYGGAFGGQVPSRVFLNDGNGFFTEFNPSGFQLTQTNIANGQPALWAQGIQQDNTVDSNGTQSDVANSPLGIELGDLDGDFDQDLIFGSRITAPRAFYNLLADSGALGFRDVTTLVFPANYWSGGNNYEQEIGDMDRDGDLDLYGLNYPGLNDAVFENVGGIFQPGISLPSSGQDDNEADFIDYDADGDMDFIVAGFAGQNKLYRNDWAGGGSGSFSYALVPNATSGLGSASSLDIDDADLDGDGDYDAMSSEDGNSNEIYYVNQTQVADTHAPYLPKVEDLGDAAASTAARAVRAYIYDNTPYYVAWYHSTSLEWSVDGVALPDVAATSSQGQIFRALVPGNLYGSVEYGFRATDEHGNTGVSGTQAYVSSHASFSSSFGTGSAGSLGVPGVKALSVPFGNSALYVAGTNAPVGTPSWLAVTNLAIPTLNLPGLCNVNVGGALLSFTAGATDADGNRAVALPVPAGFAGAQVHAQFFALNGTGGNLLSSSAGLSITLQ